MSPLVPEAGSIIQQIRGLLALRHPEARAGNVFPLDPNHNHLIDQAVRAGLASRPKHACLLAMAASPAVAEEALRVAVRHGLRREALDLSSIIGVPLTQADHVALERHQPIRATGHTAVDPRERAVSADGR